MPIINYVREHIRFIDYARDEHLSGNERLLWYALMHIMNQRAQGRMWPDDFIRISNDHLLSYCPMKFDTLASVRNRLKQRGLIDFKPGSRNKEHPSYKMFYFFPNDFYSEAEFGKGYTEIPDKTEVYTEKSDKNSPKEPFYPKNSDIMGYNMGDNMGDNTGDNMGDNTGDKMGDIGGNILYINKTENNKQDLNREEREEEEKRARVREEIQASWLKSFGTQPTPALVRALENRMMVFDFDEGVLSFAIETAAFKSVYSPVEYLISMLCEWSRNGVRTLEEAERETEKPVHNLDSELPF